jgi:hypothetical protein
VLKGAVCQTSFLRDCLVSFRLCYRDGWTGGCLDLSICLLSLSLSTSLSLYFTLSLFLSIYLCFSLSLNLSLSVFHSLSPFLSRSASLFFSLSATIFLFISICLSSSLSCLSLSSFFLSPTGLDPSLTPSLSHLKKLEFISQTGN